MPIRVIVSRSRKLSENYNSESWGLSLDTEFTGDLSNTQAFQEQVNDLFSLVDNLLDEKVQGAKGGRTASRAPANGRGASNGNARRTNAGRATNGTNGNGHRKLTYAQQKAIVSMSRKVGVNPDEWSEDQHGIPVRDLSVKQASDLIDALRREIEAQDTQGAAT